MSRYSRVSLAVLFSMFIAFSASAATLTIQVSGSGTTDPAPGSYSCSWNQKVTVWALPSYGWKFDHWENGMTGPLNPNTITMGTSSKTVVAVFTQLPAFSADTALKYFVSEVDRNYTYNCYKTQYSFGYTTYFIDMKSQVWRSAAEVDRTLWQHYLMIQKGWFTGSTAIMLIDGGSNGGTPPSTPDDTIGYMSLLTGFPVADLKQVPNQPLAFTDEPGVTRTEDDLLAYSFDKYLLTGDYKWNGHLPMTKAAIRGMDTITRQISSINKFLVCGASKRGWTTWLTAATDDSRIIGFCPIVIPILNVEDQMDHHWESYGFYSSAVQPYADFDLFCRLKSDPLADSWLEIEDPYSYIGESTTYTNKPKLLVNASGDQFFMPDALRYYWSAIPGTKHVRILPNASHGMEEGDAFDQALATAIAWGKNVKDNNANPSYTWVVNANSSITMTCASTPSGGVKLWQATNPTARDFRVETIGTVWTSSTVPNQGNNTYVGYCPPPAQGWTAYFLEADFGSDHKYTSEIVVNPDTLPYAGTHCLP